MDFLLDCALFLAGCGLGHLTTYLRPPRVITQVQTRTIAQAFGSGGVYVRFTAADGTVQVKKFAPTDLDEVMEFRGRVYEAGPFTEDGHVYNEVVSG